MKTCLQTLKSSERKWKEVQEVRILLKGTLQLIPFSEKKTNHSENIWWTSSKCHQCFHPTSDFKSALHRPQRWRSLPGSELSSNSVFTTTWSGMRRLIQGKSIWEKGVWAEGPGELRQQDTMAFDMWLWGAKGGLRKPLFTSTPAWDFSGSSAISSSYMSHTHTHRHYPLY